MRIGRIRTLLFVMLVVAGASLVAQEAEPSREMEFGRSYTMYFYRGELGRVHANFTAKFKEAMSLAKLRDSRREVSLQLGVETELLGEEIVSKDEFKIYVRRARFEKFDGIVEVVVAMREDHSIAGFAVRPAATPTDS